MAIKRIKATITVNCCKVFEAGSSHRQKTMTIDMTRMILEQPTELIRSLKDDCQVLKDMAQSLLNEGERAISVLVVDDIKRCIGVSRLSSITVDDINYARAAEKIPRIRRFNPKPREGDQRAA